MAIAIPSYLGFKDRANKSAAQANVRAAVPGIEAYAADNNGYTGVDLSALQASYDAGITNITFGQPATSTTYCVQSTVSQYTFYQERAGRRHRRRQRPARKPRTTSTSLTEEARRTALLARSRAESAVERPSRRGVPRR